jgi:nucleoside-diphosphate-sugar epimerase
MAETFFVTGAQGCIGSWVVKLLTERGDKVVVFDQSADSRRLAAIMEPDQIAHVQFTRGDITDSKVVLDSLSESAATRVIHLAGLQVPTCRVDPVAGAMVNVVGTLNLFEAVRKIGLTSVIYASSAAVFGLNDEEVALDESAGCNPSTHYGVFKRANEGNANIYYHDHGVSSVGLRPLTVYGVNRDTGLTSDPTKAMKAAVLGQSFHIRFSGPTDFQYVADTAATFIACVDKALPGANIFNLHGDTEDVEQIASFINEETPGGQLVTFGGPVIPIAPALSDAAIRRAIPKLPATPLLTGIRETMSRFSQLAKAGVLDVSDLSV